MDKTVLQRVKKALSSWVAPGKRFTYDQLTAPTQDAGLHQPLRSVANVSLSAILSRKSRSQLEEDQKGNRDSALMSDHLAHAVKLYVRSVDAPHVPNMRQRDVFQIVHENDPVPFAALARKLDPVNGIKKKMAKNKHRLWHGS